MEPFHIDVPDEVLNDLKTRLKLTRWADDFANESWQYGTNTAHLKELVAAGRIWRSGSMPPTAGQAMLATGLVWQSLPRRVGRWVRFRIGVLH